MEYALSLDDCIWFLQEIYKNNYPSVFKSGYLQLMKRLHEEYGTKVQFNLYYETPEFRGFCLSALSDRYREEWRQNRDWIRFAFHARADFPPRPYDGASYEGIYRDGKLVRDEIIRFAGEELLSDTATVHFFSGGYEECRALRDLGIKNIMGAMKNSDRVYFHLTEEQSETAKRTGKWYDSRLDLNFFAGDLILDRYSCDEIEGILEENQRKYPENSFVDMTAHEQYYYCFYKQFQSDYERKLRTGIEWCLRHGYQPSGRCGNET